LGGARVYKGLSSIPEFVRGISEASGRVLAWIGVELAKPSGSLPDNVYVIVKALGDLLASLRRLLPLYNPVTRYLTGLYSIPVALARDLYGMRGRDYVEVEVGDFIVSVEMDTVLDYPAGRELSIVGAANGSVSHELTRLVFLAYKVFGTSDLASFYSGVRDELSAYWRHLRSIEGGNYSLFKARYVESVKGVLSSLCVVCPCDGEPFAASLRDKRYGSMYSRALCGHLDLEGDQILVNGSKFDYRKLIVHLSPLLFTGFAQIRRNRGKVVMAMLDTSKPTVE
nr:hypothetical protein [Desulfurococcales archaeon]